MTLKEAKRRIEELERKVLELQLRPLQQIHYHYQTPYYPWWQYQPYYNPLYVGGAGVGTAGTGLGAGTACGAVTAGYLQNG